MNVYEKLLEARRRFHASEVKKSGWNDFSNYAYFELADFVVPMLGIFHDLKLLAHVSFTKEMATMDIINIEKPEERITFTSPMAGAALKAAHEIQQLGAVETYQRRYLYVMALDIVEHDVLENSRPADDPFTRMRAAITLEQLMREFGDAYKATKDKAERSDIEAEYKSLKAKFVIENDSPAT